MRLFRFIAAHLASFGCVLAISILIWFAALQTSLFNVSVVKGWLHDSGIYSKALPALVTIQTSQADDVLTPTAAQQAFTHAFSPEFIQQQTEVVLDSMYTWMDGRSSTVTFSIPIDQKKALFAEQLANAIKPEIEKLPICAANTQSLPQELKCRPPSIQPKELAQSAALQVVNDSHFLDKPLTDKVLASVLGREVEVLGRMQMYYYWFKQLLVLLPVALVILLVIILLTAVNKLEAFARLGKRIFFGSAFTLALAAAMVYLGGSDSSLASLGMGSSSPLLAVFVPLVQKVVQGIGWQLAIWSGLAAGMSLVVWQVLRITRHKQDMKKVLLSAKQEQEVVVPGLVAKDQEHKNAGSPEAGADKL